MFAPRPLTIVASQTSTTNNTGTTSVPAPTCPNGLVLELDVTAAATAAGDTLDVFVQTRIDGTNWVDIAHFTQVLGNGGTKRFFCKITPVLAEALFENGAALAAGSVRNLLGPDLRCRWTVASASAPSFTFGVYCCPN